MHVYKNNIIMLHNNNVIIFKKYGKEKQFLNDVRSSIDDLPEGKKNIKLVNIIKHSFKVSSNCAKSI